MADLGTAEELREEGNRLFGEGNYAQAIETYTRSLDQKKDAVNFCQRAQAYLEVERPDLALDDTNAALDLNGKSLQAWHSKALALEQLGRQEEMIPVLSTCIRLSPQDKDVLNRYWQLRFEKLQMTKFAEPSGDSVIYDRLVIGQSWQPNTPVDYGLYQGNHLIRCHSLEDLSQRLANCHSGIASVTFANIVIDDAFLTFLRSVDPKCFGVFVLLQDVQMEQHIGEKLFDGLINPFFLAIKGLSGFKGDFNGYFRSPAFLQASSVVLVAGLRGPDLVPDRLSADAVVEWVHTPLEPSLFALLPQDARWNFAQELYEHTRRAFRADCRHMGVREAASPQQFEAIFAKFKERFVSDASPDTLTYEVTLAMPKKWSRRLSERRQSSNEKYYNVKHERFMIEGLKRSEEEDKYDFIIAREDPDYAFPRELTDEPEKYGPVYGPIW